MASRTIGPFKENLKQSKYNRFYSSPISTRGFSEFIFEYCRSSSFVSSEITFGSVTCTSTN